jgi:fatty-acyl-CoA synthase
MHGAALLISDGFEPARTLARLGDGALGITHYFCVPQMAAMLRGTENFDPAALRRLTAIFTGGAPHRAEAIRAWLADGIPIVDGFGMSEAGTVFGMPLDPALIDAKAGSCGVPTPAVQARIVDADDRDCPDDTAGELLLRGDNIFSGYWRQPEETTKTFTQDGWFRTGDIATRDADGFYRLVDRKKDMFISGGENVFPAEIEAALAGFPGILEAAVVGVPDARWGEVGHLAIVVAAPVAEDAILAHLRARLAGYKLPRHISVVDTLPRTGTGKLQKTILRTSLTAAK